MDYNNGAPAARRDSGNGMQTSPSAMLPPPLPTRAQRFYVTRTGMRMQESQFKKHVDNMIAQAQAGQPIPQDKSNEVCWMLQQHHPNHPILQGRRFHPPPGTTEQVVKRAGVAAKEFREMQQKQQQQPQQPPPDTTAQLLRRAGQAAMEYAKKQQQPQQQQRSPAPTVNMIPTYASQNTQPQFADPIVDEAIRQVLEYGTAQATTSNIIDPRLSAPRTSTTPNVIDPRLSAPKTSTSPNVIDPRLLAPKTPTNDPNLFVLRARPMHPQAQTVPESYMSNIRLDAHFTPLSCSPKGQARHSNFSAGAQHRLPSDPPIIPVRKPSQPPPVTPQIGYFAAPVPRLKEPKLPQATGNVDTGQLQQQGQPQASSDVVNTGRLQQQELPQASGAKLKATLDAMTVKALNVAIGMNFMSKNQAVQVISKLRGDSAQQWQFIDQMRKAVKDRQSKARAQRASSQVVPSNTVIDLAAVEPSSKKRKEPPIDIEETTAKTKKRKESPTDYEQPAAKRQEVIDLTGSDEPVNKPKTQQTQPEHQIHRKRHPQQHRPPTHHAPQDITNMSQQQLSTLMDLDRDYSTKIHPLRTKALTHGVSLADIMYEPDNHTFPVEPVQSILDPPEEVQENMRRRNAARKPDIYFAEPSIAAAYDAVRTDKVDFGYSETNSGYVKPVNKQTWPDIHDYTILEADGSRRAIGYMSEERAAVWYELKTHAMRYGWRPRKGDGGNWI